jgi:hypothetical protein
MGFHLSNVLDWHPEICKHSTNHIQSSYQHHGDKAGAAVVCISPHKTRSNDPLPRAIVTSVGDMCI